MKKGLLKIIGFVFFAILMVVNLMSEYVLQRENNLNLSSLIAIAYADGETSTTVPCYDTEDIDDGGIMRARVCADGTVAICDWRNFNSYSEKGTCTLSD